MYPQSDLVRDPFQTYVLAVARATLQNGGTASKLNDYQLLPPMNAWQFPKYPSRTRILPSEADLVVELKEFILANETFLREPDCWLGTWIHPETHCFYLDITTSCNELERAKQMALEISEREGRKIVAIYN